MKLGKTTFKPRLLERQTILVFMDFVMAVSALVLSLVIWGMRADWLGLSIEFLTERVPFWFYLLPLAWMILLVELYDVHRSTNLQQTIRGLLATSGVAAILYFLVYVISEPGSLPRLGVALFVGLVVVLTFLWRMLYIRIFTLPRFLRRVLVVGGGKAGSTILELYESLNPKPFVLVGVIDDDPEKLNTSILGHEVIGNSSQLKELVQSEGISDLIVAISGEIKGETFQRLLDIQEVGIDITRMPVAYEQLISRVPIRLLEADWILRSFVDVSSTSVFYSSIKRVIDILGGLVGTVIFVFALPFIAVAIVIDNGLPVLYSQERLGRGGDIFQILKFRTMVREAEKEGTPQWAKEDDPRATRVGRILRKSHLDELPQFLNVLRGDMSLVGPRAERPGLVEYYQGQVPFYRARLLVKPGLTGWAQINYKYTESIDETIIKLEYDLYYIKRKNLMLDLLILIRTPSTMFLFKGR